MAIFFIYIKMQEILSEYPQFKESTIRDRFTKHGHIVCLIEALPPVFTSSIAGYSKEGRSIHLIQCGNGTKKIMLWSQMHGDEATGTMAMFDLLNFIGKEVDPQLNQNLLSRCTIYLIPMLNPDGAARFSRRNAQQIDINRDYNQRCSPEARILADLQEKIKPDFGFNLHDQSTLWSVAGSKKPATLSFLAPAYNEVLDMDETRTQAMLVIASIYAKLDAYLPGQIGLFDDAHESRACGDNFQARGTSTILIEAGGLAGDLEKQEIRKYYLLSLLEGLRSIATGDYNNESTSSYFGIPQNTKELFHLLIQDAVFEDIRVSIGLNYKEITSEQGLEYDYVVEDIGDLSNWSAYEIYTGDGLQISGALVFNEPANFDLLQAGEIILSFKNGKLQSKQ
jgi:hypothetical protein